MRPWRSLSAGVGGHRDKQREVAGDVRRRTSLSRKVHRSRKYKNKKLTTGTTYMTNIDDVRNRSRRSFFTVEIFEGISNANSFRNVLNNLYLTLPFDFRRHFHHTCDILNNKTLLQKTPRFSEYRIFVTSQL